MTINSRNKGAGFERELARELLLLTGITFARDLEQYRQTDRGDLLADDPAWPFVVEAKRYADGTGCKREWQAQAEAAANAAGKFPCVIYKFDRREIRVSLPLNAIGAGFNAHPETPDIWADISLEGFAWLASEIMAWRAE